MGPPSLEALKLRAKDEVACSLNSAGVFCLLNSFHCGNSWTDSCPAAKPDTAGFNLDHPVFNVDKTTFYGASIATLWSMSRIKKVIDLLFACNFFPYEPYTPSLSYFPRHHLGSKPVNRKQLPASQPGSTHAFEDLQLGTAAPHTSAGVCHGRTRHWPRNSKWGTRARNP